MAPTDSFCKNVKYKKMARKSRHMLMMVGCGWKSLTKEADTGGSYIDLQVNKKSWH